MMLKLLRDQQALCFLEKGEVSECMQGDPSLFDTANIDIQGESGGECSFALCGPATKNFIYSLDGQYIQAERRPHGTKYYLETTAQAGSGSSNQIICENEDSKDWCKIIGFKQNTDGLYVQP